MQHGMPVVEGLLCAAANLCLLYAHDFCCGWGAAIVACLATPAQRHDAYGTPPCNPSPQLNTDGSGPLAGFAGCDGRLRGGEGFLLMRPDPHGPSGAGSLSLGLSSFALSLVAAMATLSVFSHLSHSCITQLHYIVALHSCIT